jgi:hypothetical protein
MKRSNKFEAETNKMEIKRITQRINEGVDALKI